MYSDSHQCWLHNLKGQSHSVKAVYTKSELYGVKHQRINDCEHSIIFQMKLPLFFGKGTKRSVTVMIKLLTNSKVIEGFIKENPSRLERFVSLD